MQTTPGSFLAVAAALACLQAVPPAEADEMVSRIVALTESVTPQVVAWRRDIHAHPELSNREERTARVVAESLRAMGIEEMQTGVAHHGVVALVRGGRPGPVVALRADMDALPIQEETGLPFASKHDGVMHACGHDAHTAMLLGAAQVLLEIRDAIPGTVKLIFQPAEEGVPPGEEGGARMMVAEGVLEEPDVSAIFGMHVSPDLETGTLGYGFGGVLAAVDRFQITVVGQQSHGAYPWQGVDPIVTAAQIVTALQTITSRKVDAREPVVVSVGIVRGGTAWNIIPERVFLEGTIRTHDAEVRRRAAAEFHRLVEMTAAAHGASVEVEFSDYGPAVWNDPELGRRSLPSLARSVGEENLVEMAPRMGGEDFAYYAQEVPGFFISLGVRNEEVGAVYPLHTPKFTIDEEALPVGVRTLVLMALDYLQAAEEER